MILTGKAKEDFEKWYFETQCSSNMKFNELLPHHINDVFGWLYNSSKIIQSSFIIEFFDSKEIIVNVSKWSLSFWRSSIYNPYHNSLGCGFKTRQEATEKAIIKANEIYNEMK